ncbi:hypothetical protein [uncultured Jannaschia sp.]|uniref:hypothetical protein n=1 Tax=uncultured Jannaschia sp. TaxID=293347 RepID=UPI002627B8E5|nr:hypothetical protein [uncultured Jannaschia sp.]
MSDRRFEYVEQRRAQGLPEAEPYVMEGLRDIVDEGVLGASNHVALALPLVARLAAEPRATAGNEALELAQFIAGTRGLGAPIVANALRWQTDGAAQAEDAAALLHARAEHWGVTAAERRRALLAKGVAALDGYRRPLIFDYSSTVADLVRAMADRGGLDRIVIPESRSIDGGRRYMTALADLGVPILFVPDAAIDYAASRSSVLLLGAESVTRDGGISNTVGSIVAARAALSCGLPVYGAADLFKVGERDAAELPAPELRRYDFLLKEGEVASTEAPEIEIVPPALVTAILTEIGPVAPEAIADARVHRAP